MGCECMRARKIEVPERLETMPVEPRSPKVKLTPPSASAPVTPRGRRNRPRLMSLGVSSHIRVLKQPLTQSYHVLEEREHGELLAEYVSTNQLCRIQVVSKNDKVALSKPRSKLRQDARTMCELDHPHLPRVFEVMEDMENYYVASEAFNFGTLKTFVQEREVLREKIAAHIMGQILSAVAYCHSRRVIHPALSLDYIVLKKPAMSDNKALIAVYGFDVLFPPSPCTKVNVVYEAPESYNGLHHEKSDIWSCGMILYYLLAKDLPVSAVKYLGELEKGRHVKIEFPSEGWKRASADVKALISSMLAWTAEYRPTAADCLQHKWFQQFSQKCTSFKPVGLSLSNMAATDGTAVLKDAIKSFIIQRILKAEHLEEVSHSFKTLDADGDGQLDRSELLRGLLKMMPQSKAEVEADRLITIADRNGNGRIDYSEFLLSSFDDKELLTRENLAAAFKSIDLDGSGTITMRELKRAFCIEGYRGDTDQVWNQLMQKADLSGDGVIDFKEFTELMLGDSLSR